MKISLIRKIRIDLNEEDVILIMNALELLRDYSNGGKSQTAGEMLTEMQHAIERFQ